MKSEISRRKMLATIGGASLGSIIPLLGKIFLVAGRWVSSDRLANSGLRVQASCMGVGQSAAAVAVLASRMKISPAYVPVNKIKKLLSNHGTFVPG